MGTRKALDKPSARQEVLDVFGEAARSVAREQVRLALEAEDESVRGTACRNILGLVVYPDGQGAGAGRGVLPATAIQIVNNIPMPEYRMPLSAVAVEQLGVGGGDVASPPAKPPKLIEPALAKKAEWVKDESKTVVHEVK